MLVLYAVIGVFSSFAIISLIEREIERETETGTETERETDRERDGQRERETDGCFTLQ